MSVADFTEVAAVGVEAFATPTVPADIRHATPSALVKLTSLRLKVLPPEPLPPQKINTRGQRGVTVKLGNP